MPNKTEKSAEVLAQFEGLVRHVEMDRYTHAPLITFELNEGDVNAGAEMMKCEANRDWVRVIVVKVK